MPIDSSFPFQRSTIEKVNLSQNKIEKLKNHFSDYDIETCMIFKSNALVYQYEQAENLINIPHKVNSVTKSVLSSLIGIALEKDYLSSIDQPVTNYLSSTEYKSSHLKDLTIKHLLTMTSGLDSTKWKHAIESRNPVNGILTDSFYSAPGEKMVYNNSDSHLLNAVLENVTGMNPSVFLEKYLFQPLQISNYTWKKDSSDLPIGGYGLYLTPVDLLKYAVLILQKGQWQGKQLISKDWLKEATSPHVPTEKSNQSFGYHWWVSHSVNDLQPSFYYAAGRGGKFIFVSPNQELAVTFTANLPSHDSLLPFQWFVRYILNNH